MSSEKGEEITLPHAIAKIIFFKPSCPLCVLMPSLVSSSKMKSLRSSPRIWSRKAVTSGKILAALGQRPGEHKPAPSLIGLRRDPFSISMGLPLPHQPAPLGGGPDILQASDITISPLLCAAAFTIAGKSVVSIEEIKEDEEEGTIGQSTPSASACCFFAKILRCSCRASFADDAQLIEAGKRLRTTKSLHNNSARNLQSSAG